MKKYILLTLLFVSAAIQALADERDSIFISHWDQPSCWFQTSDSIYMDKVDVFYVTSTNVLESHYPDGTPSMRAVLNEQDRRAFSAEMAFMRDSTFYHDFNFYAPYYHQFNFFAIRGGKEAYSQTFRDVAQEVCDAFDYYITHENRGRRFILAGFSQGAMMVLQLLRHISDEQYGRMVAAYVMGYRLSAEDLQHPHIQAAQNATDRGVAISFNSAFTREGQWPAVAEGAITCINPLNWRTDATPATMSFKGGEFTVRVDSETNTLLVDGDRTFFHSWMKKYPFLLNAGASIDNLHHWDILFYTHQIHDNAVLRTSPPKSPLREGM